MNFYDVLGVDRNADRAEIRGAYRDLARRYHPDVNGHPDARDQFRVLSTARDVLTDPDERSAYDRLGHADYVSARIDGDLPNPEMTPKPEDEQLDASDGDGAGGARPSAGSTETGSSSSSSRTGGRASTSGARKGADGSEAGSGGGGSPRGDSATDAGTGSPSGSADRSTAGGESGTSSGGATSGGGPGSAADAREPTDGAGDTAREGPERDGEGKAYSTPPTPGRSPGGQDSTEDDARAGESDREGWASRPDVAVPSTVRSHLAASNRWLGVLAAAVLYFGGLAGYLSRHADPVGDLWADLSSLEPGRVASAVTGAPTDPPGLLAYALGGPAPGATGTVVGMLAVAGALVLPGALAGAVVGNREETTWRPSPLYLVGGVAPLCSLVLAYATGAGSSLVPAGGVPLLYDLLLLVVCPGLTVVAFLLDRLVLVAPLRRLDDLE